ncbi:MAG: hypothetical protein R3284_02530 [Rubricoccaceae bacterium]|nr:hypothetical protein [Rubricoccaceae bacterium]
MILPFHGLQIRIPTMVLGAFLLSALVGCGNEALDVSSTDYAPVDLDKSNEERLLRYYLSGYVSREGGDPVESGLFLVDGGFALNPRLLDVQHRRQLEDTDQNGEIGWDEFVAFIEGSYADARGLPLELEFFRREADWRSDTNDWFSVDIDGVMTEARRRVYVPVSAIRSALEGFDAAENELIYPPGTIIVGEHRDGDTVLETTIKRKRPDGFWDFAVYDADGRLASATSTGPRSLNAPIQCVGCHLGRRTFDPEKSFPAEAPDGPHGARAIHVADDLRNAEATTLFDEHARRSDGVLGLYCTLYTAGLLSEREAGTISDDDRVLLQHLGL